MTEIYYLDTCIHSDKIKEFSVSAKYSEIRIGNKTVREIIEDLFQQQDLKTIDDVSALDQLTASDDILIFSTSVFSKDLPALAKFLKFSSYSMINAFWGHQNCFIYKGNKDRFVSYITENSRKDIYFLHFPEYILDLTSLHEVKALLSNSHDSRHFNDIKSVGELYIKKSSNATKLQSEYDFLNNVPDHLKRYYVQVFEFSRDPEFAQYSMVSYDYKDVSHLYLSNSLNEESFQILMSLIKKYFEDSRNVAAIKYEKNSFEDLIRKNSSRLEQLKDVSYYEALNSFLINYKGISISDHHERIERELKKRERTYRKANYIFSHGDLCFSNILFSPQNMDMKLIDPKGFENNGMRSPYYDMAKLSHSIYGNYDLIINSMAAIDFDEEMNARLNFSTYDYIKNFDSLFLNLVKSMKLDMTLIRLVEASFFLSMIPFHYENKRKAFMLCLRSVEIFEEL